MFQSLRILIQALVALALAGGTALAQPIADGTILERGPCPLDADPQAFAQAVQDYFQADILKAGLDRELASRPLSTVFTQAEHQRLIAAANQGRCERVAYASGGLRVIGFVLRPAAAGPHPVLIWLRGGNREFGKIEPVTLLNLAWLADAGFVVVATQYRGVDGGQGADEFGGADVEDVHALLPLARTLPQADTERLYLLGGSRGAMQGALAMRQGLPVRAAAFRGGLYDLKSALVSRPALETGWKEMMLDHAANRDQALERRSAVAWAGSLGAPVLLLHGRQDWRAPVDDALAFDVALGKAGATHRLVIYEGDEHQLAFHRPEWLAEAVAWFRAHGAFEPGDPGPSLSAGPR